MLLVIKKLFKKVALKKKVKQEDYTTTTHVIQSKHEINIKARKYH